MRRGAKPVKAKVEAKLPSARKPRKNQGSKVRDLENRLAEALEQQTATSEILRVISSSPTDVQPVLDAVAESAARLCDGYDGVIHRLEDDVLRLVAHHGPIAGAPQGYRQPAIRGTAAGRSVCDGTTVHVADLQAEVLEFPEGSTIARRFGHRTVLSVPLLREGVAIGAIVLRRTEVRPFSDTQIKLLQTFADQAAIAIENVRLFTESQEQNRALTHAHAQVTEALEQQTATAEVLKVISRSTFDLQPVLDTLIENATRLCASHRGVIMRRAGDSYHGVAFYNVSPELIEFIKCHPIAPGRHSITARVALERRTIHVEDLQADPEYRYVLRDTDPIRTELGVPLFRGDDIVGVIILHKLEVEPFTDKQIELVETFADQAVIAIENVRLFNETKEALEQQTATADILRVIAASPTDVQPVFDTIVESAARLCHAQFCHVLRFDGTLLHVAAHHGMSPEGVAALQSVYPLAPGRGSAAGRSILSVRIEQIPDTNADADFRHSRTAAIIGAQSIVAVPMLRDGMPIGSIVAGQSNTGVLPERLITLLQTFADQAVIAIENVRLFKGLEGANRKLSAASQHKSEFLANMSHELRTPLNAIIGFSEVLSERMFGDLNEKQEEYSKDIHASGQHLLSLINDILDLSKIEAGRMELELTDFDLPMAIENALMLVRERAGRRSLTLHKSVDAGVGQLRADERKIRQVVLNLLSNAIKFTPEGGRIEVGAVPRDGFVEVSVSDTGVGIAPEDQERVFEEFRQVGTAEKKAEGTGLGLTLCRKFIELHGGRIWVTSQVGVGSTFTFTIPVRRAE